MGTPGPQPQNIDSEHPSGWSAKCSALCRQTVRKGSAGPRQRWTGFLWRPGGAAGETQGQVRRQTPPQSARRVHPILRELHRATGLEAASFNPGRCKEVETGLAQLRSLDTCEKGVNTQARKRVGPLIVELRNGWLEARNAAGDLASWGKVLLLSKTLIYNPKGTGARGWSACARGWSA